MHSTTALLLSYANCINYKRYIALKEQYGSLDAAMPHINRSILKVLGVRKTTIEEVLKRMQNFDSSKYIARLQQAGITFMSIEDEQYPPLLKQAADPPVFLYIQGNVQALHMSLLAAVGTRNISVNGKRLTEHFIPQIVRSGMATVSGLALGIDAEVAIQTLQANGVTVAVLGGGLGYISPASNYMLSQRIVRQGGALVSEYPFDVPPQKHTFPARNRIVAGLSQATLVLEAGKGSGALITARLAFDYDREVYAVPGTIFNKNMIGCLEIIADQTAQVALSPQQILQVLNRSTTPKQVSLFTPKNAVQTSLWQLLSAQPQSVEELCTALQKDAGTLSAELTILELQHAAKNIGDGTWVKI